MNPGPFGMAQTGIPFGEIQAVRFWMGIEESVEKPAQEHPARPVVGFAIKRSEISGQRLWGLMQARYGPADEFFKEHAVMNYCPLVFVDKGKTGKNVVPEKLLKNERELLESFCDAYLKDVIAFIGPHYLVGVGKYAEKKLYRAMLGTSIEKESPKVFSILHPSPGSPLANAGWGQKVTAQLQEAGIWK
jgi:single-strand selective monofunctional uracil DNA glycosylase